MFENTELWYEDMDEEDFCVEENELECYEQAKAAYHDFLKIAVRQHARLERVQIHSKPRELFGRRTMDPLFEVVVEHPVLRSLGIHFDGNTEALIEWLPKLSKLISLRLSYEHSDPFKHRAFLQALTKNLSIVEITKAEILDGMYNIEVRKVLVRNKALKKINAAAELGNLGKVSTFSWPRCAKQLLDMAEGDASPVFLFLTKTSGLIANQLERRQKRRGEDNNSPKNKRTRSKK